MHTSARSLLWLMLLVLAGNSSPGQSILDEFGLIQISYIRIHKGYYSPDQVSEQPFLTNKEAPELISKTEELIKEIPASGDLFKDFPSKVEVITLEVMDGYFNRRFLYFYNGQLRAPNAQNGTFYQGSSQAVHLYKVIEMGLERGIRKSSGLRIDQQDLLLYLPFSGDTRDHSKNGHHGISLGATLTVDRFGKADQAYAFDGESSRIEVDDHPHLRLGETDYNLSLWFLEEDHNNHNSGALITKRGEGRGNGWYLGTNGLRKGLQENVFFTISGGADPLAVTSGNHVSLGKWHHLSLNYFNKTDILHIYIDGVLVLEQKDFPGPNPEASAKLILGYDAPTKLYGFKGKIDEVYIFSRVLSPEEIMSLLEN